MNFQPKCVKNDSHPNECISLTSGRTINLKFLQIEILVNHIMSHHSLFKLDFVNSQKCIFEYLSVGDRFKMEKVCKRWAQIAKDHGWTKFRTFTYNYRTLPATVVSIFAEFL